MTGRPFEVGSWVAYGLGLFGYSPTACMGRVIGFSKSGTVKITPYRIAKRATNAEQRSAIIHYVPGRSVLRLPVEATDMTWLILSDFKDDVPHDD